MSGENRSQNADRSTGCGRRGAPSRGSGNFIGESGDVDAARLRGSDAAGDANWTSELDGNASRPAELRHRMRNSELMFALASSTATPRGRQAHLARLAAAVRIARRSATTRRASARRRRRKSIRCFK
jgi:hypothetical protein